jgi:hypothetical protein
MNQIWPRLTKVNLFTLLIWENDLNEVPYLIQFNTNLVVDLMSPNTQHKII